MVIKGKFRKSNMMTWFTIQTLAILIAAMLAFLFVIFSTRYFYGRNILPYSYALGLILPLSALFSIVNYMFFFMMMKYIAQVSDAIELVSHGDFDHQLPESKSIFQSVNRNFNKMCAELQNVQMLRNDFINSYSHEFKTPITSINGFAELLMKQDVSAEEREQYLKIIYDESARLAQLANSTLLFAALDKQEIVEDKERYRLDEQIRRCAIALAPKWNEKNIALVCDTQEITYFGNPQLMEHVWRNLIDNAIKFTPKNGEISVTLKKSDGAIVVTVTDTGIGMNEEVAAHIFDKYFQASTSPQNSGIGLGLAIVRRIVNLCGGRISVDSAPDQGSTFTVRL